MRTGYHRTSELLELTDHCSHHHHLQVGESKGVRTYGSQQGHELMRQLTTRNPTLLGTSPNM
ncbi:hypothetical protein PIB30_097548, partial [Stylosanthes scabra]|nr:hypothetical protein [Stylosanthes scabra]